MIPPPIIQKPPNLKILPKTLEVSITFILVKIPAPLSLHLCLVITTIITRTNRCAMLSPPRTSMVLFANLISLMKILSYGIKLIILFFHGLTKPYLLTSLRALFASTQPSNFGKTSEKDSQRAIISVFLICYMIPFNQIRWSLSFSLNTLPISRFFGMNSKIFVLYLLVHATHHVHVVF